MAWEANERAPAEYFEHFASSLLWKWQVQKGPLWPREKGPPETGAVAGIEAVCVP